MISIFLKHHIYEICIDVIFDGIRKHFTTVKPQDFDLMRLEELNQARMDELEELKNDPVGYCTKNGMRLTNDKIDKEWNKVMDRLSKRIGFKFHTFPSIPKW